MKLLNIYINEGIRGLNRTRFRHFSMNDSAEDMTIDNISSAIWGFMSGNADRIKLYNKEFNTLKSVFKTIEKNEDTDEFYGVYRRIKRKANLKEDITEEDIKLFIKDNDEQLSKDKDLQKIEI